MSRLPRYKRPEIQNQEEQTTPNQKQIVKTRMIHWHFSLKYVISVSSAWKSLFSSHVDSCGPCKWKILIWNTIWHLIENIDANRNNPAENISRIQTSRRPKIRRLSPSSASKTAQNLRFARLDPLGRRFHGTAHFGRLEVGASKKRWDLGFSTETGPESSHD